VKLRTGIAVGIVSLAAAAGLASPAYAAAVPGPPPPPHGPVPPPPAPPGPPAPHRHHHQPPPPRAADNCWLDVNNGHPGGPGWETLTVHSTVARTTVQVDVSYWRSSRTWDFTTGRDGRAVYQFNLGRPARGTRVTLVGTVTGAPRGYRTGATCVTSFVAR
jgi:hypothetical protein